MKQLEMLYEGKAKQVFLTDDPDKIIIHYKDAATAFNNVKKATIENKGVLPIAEEYAHRGLLLPDLVQEGSLGLLIGVDTLGLKEEEQSWEAYLEHEIRRAIRTALDEQAGSDSTGEQITEKLNRLADSITELTEDMGRQITPEELSMYLDMPLEEIEGLLRVAGENIEMADEKQTDS